MRVFKYFLVTGIFVISTMIGAFAYSALPMQLPTPDSTDQTEITTWTSMIGTLNLGSPSRLNTNLSGIAALYIPTKIPHNNSADSSNNFRDILIKVQSSCFKNVIRQFVSDLDDNHTINLNGFSDYCRVDKSKPLLCNDVKFSITAYDMSNTLVKSEILKCNFEIFEKD